MGNFSTYFSNEADHRAWLEQYKILAESLHKLNEMRENSNNFWVGVNGLGVSAIAYLRDVRNIASYHKSFLLITLLIVGIIFCLSWLSYLHTLKQSIETRGGLLVDMEKKLPAQPFSKVFNYSPEHSGKSVLTGKEMFVPYLFLMGYVFFAILLFLFPEAVAPLVKGEAP